MSMIVFDHFSAVILKIGINPYVSVPTSILKKIFKAAGKDKGHIPVRLLINRTEFIQHLVKYSGQWRLYLNMPMRKAAGKDTGDKISIGICFDEIERELPVNTRFEKALRSNKKASAVFDSLPPSRKKEIVRYINNLKTETAVEKNINKAIGFLLGEQRFVGRDRP